MKNNQKNLGGFAVFELLFFLLVAAVLIGGAYYVGKNHSKKTTPVNSSASNDAAASTDNWKTFSDKDSANSVYADQGGAVETGDSVPISFEYPSDWSIFPQGTVVKPSGASFEGPANYNQVVPAGKTKNDLCLTFRSIPTTTDANSTAKTIIGDQSALSGPIWTPVSGFTTKNGYSAYTNKLGPINGITTYEVVISNEKSAAIFNYNSNLSNNFATFRQIFDTVKLL